MKMRCAHIKKLSPGSKFIENDFLLQQIQELNIGKQEYTPIVRNWIINHHSNNIYKFSLYDTEKDTRIFAGLFENVCVLSHFNHVFFNSMDCNMPSSSVLGILQARTLEWIAIPSYRLFENIYISNKNK